MNPNIAPLAPTEGVYKKYKALQILPKMPDVK